MHPDRNVFLARALATVGGVGYAPRAPGTAGTLAAVPLVFATAALPDPAFWALCALVAAAAIWAADVADRSWGTRDAPHIVIDEVAGYLVAAVAIDRGSAVSLFAAFALFRFFDIAKPPPIRQVERRVGGGAGVVLDDLVAGIYAAVVLGLAAYFGWLTSP